jgi:hypothetical protein
MALPTTRAVITDDLDLFQYPQPISRSDAPHAFGTVGTTVADRVGGDLATAVDRWTAGAYPQVGAMSSGLC